MKVKDIKIPTISNNPTVKDIKHTKDFQNVEHLDATYIDSQDPDLTDEERNPKIRAGYYSHVKPHPNPHMINKINTAQDNAYSLFIKFLTNNENAKDNIHFPRIHEIKKFTKNGNHSVIQYVMEKLHMTLYDYIRDDLDNLEMLCNIYLKDSIAEKYTELKNDKKKLTLFLRQNYSIPVPFVQDILNPENIKLESFKEALYILKGFLKQATKIGHRVDLHGNNLMVRLTNTGPQIVIIDPVSNNDEDEDEDEDEWV